MTKFEIRNEYRYHSSISYDYAVYLLKKLGFTAYAAEQFLFAEG